MIRRNPSFAWTRNRSRGTMTCARRYRPTLENQPSRTMRMNGAARRTYLASWKPKAGRHFSTSTPNRSGAEFARIPEHVVEQYPAVKTIHLVMDNLNIHCRKSLTDSFGEQKGGHLGSAHRALHPKTRKLAQSSGNRTQLILAACLGKRRIPDLRKLKRETKAWNRRANQKRTKINWRFTRKKARRCSSTNRQATAADRDWAGIQPRRIYGCEPQGKLRSKSRDRPKRTPTKGNPQKSVPEDRSVGPNRHIIRTFSGSRKLARPNALQQE